MRFGEREESQYMISYCHDRIGLSNRIKNICSCLRMAEDVGVYWTSSSSFFKYAPLNYYFPELKEVKNIHGKKVRQSWRLATKQGDVPVNFSNKTRVYEKLVGRKLSPSIPDGTSIDFEYHRIPQKIKNEYTDIIKSLKISQNLIDLTERFSDKNFNDKTISVHIRTFKDSIHHQSTFYPGLERYHKLMDKYEDSNFFVASDDHAVIHSLQERYGKDRIFYREPMEKISDDFVELLLLSRASRMIGTPWSTYTELSWWLGGANKPIDIPWKQKDWTIY